MSCVLWVPILAKLKLSKQEGGPEEGGENGGETRQGTKSKDASTVEPLKTAWIEYANHSNFPDSNDHVSP